MLEAGRIGWETPESGGDEPFVDLTPPRQPLVGIALVFAIGLVLGYRVSLSPWCLGRGPFDPRRTRSQGPAVSHLFPGGPPGWLDARSSRPA